MQEIRSLQTNGNETAKKCGVTDTPIIKTKVFDKEVTSILDSGASTNVCSVLEFLELKRKHLIFLVKPKLAVNDIIGCESFVSWKAILDFSSIIG